MANKKLILLLTFILFLVFLFFLISHKETQNDIAVQHYAPPLNIKDDVSGRIFTSGDFRNKVLFVNFWASWCQPCREEMPSIESLFKVMLQHDDFQMITILYRDPYQAGVAYMKENGYSFPVYSDNNGITAKNFGVTGVPETYIIDKKGKLLKRVLGPAEWNSPEVEGLLNSLMNK